MQNSSTGNPKLKWIILIAAVVVILIVAVFAIVKFAGIGKNGASVALVKGMQVTEKTFHGSEFNDADQVIVVTAKSLNTWDAHLETYQKYDGKWYRGLSVVSKIGSAGLAYDNKRIEGSMTTPIGIYDLPYAFGVKKNPGTKMPYRIVDENTYYDGQYGSKTYNKLVQGQPANNEYEYMFSPAYLYGVDIGFNPEQKVGKGNGIFLHCFTDAGKTAGCVSISKSDIVKVLKWITPTAKPKILICLDSALHSYLS